MMQDCDFSGWATKNDLRCTDGRIIRKGAFDDDDGKKVPLLWNHVHNDPTCVLGHAILQVRDEGVYAYAYLNENKLANDARNLVNHGDIDGFSIWANELLEDGHDVKHASIKELSLVLARANPGALITDIRHNDGAFGFDGVCIYSGEKLYIQHSESEEPVKKDEEKPSEEPIEQEDVKIGEVLESMTDMQKVVVYGLLNKALEEKPSSSEENDETEKNIKEDKEMKHNVFDREPDKKNDVLAHSNMQEILRDGKRYGTLSESFIQHGITNIEYLFPDAKMVPSGPEFVKRKTGWVDMFLNNVKRTPFSRVKSVFVDITAEEARAKGYAKTKKKVEEIITLLKRTTDPQTIYKKQKIDRDDMIDITDINVLSMIKTEMRMMLNEEIARACIVGDGRLSSVDDKIKEDHVRPIWKDDEVYTIKHTITRGENDSANASAFVDACVLAQEEYDGSGSPTLWVSQKTLTNCLLLKDTTGRRIYKDVKELATAMSVSEIVVVPVMKDVKDESNNQLMGVIFNPIDFSIGADKGGEINMFDDFDIDFNAYKYLIETRISGALIRPHSAISIMLAAEA